MSKIFISHSSVDVELVREFVHLLKHGMGIPDKYIFCSSTDGTDIPIGSNFIEYIKSELDDLSILLALVTSNYYESSFCMYELGASWMKCAIQIPILFPPLEYGNLKDFLSNIMAVKADEWKKLNKLKERLKEFSEIEVNDSSWEEYRTAFISKIKAIKNRPQYESPTIQNLRITENPYKYKVIAFDLDGTMLQGTRFDYSWRLVWDFLGYDDEERKSLLRRHVGNSREYPYERWCRECGEKFKEKNLKKSDIRKIVKEGYRKEGAKFKEGNLQEATGLRPLLCTLKSQGFITAVISGGIDTFYEYGLKPKTRQYIDQVFINRFVWNPDSSLKEVLPMDRVVSDFSGKVKVLEKICAEANCDLDQAVYVGEGFNDSEVAKSPCLAIAYPAARADHRFKMFVNKQVDDANICYILQYVLEMS